MNARIEELLARIKELLQVLTAVLETELEDMRCSLPSQSGDTAGQRGGGGMVRKQKNSC